MKSIRYDFNQRTMQPDLAHCLLGHYDISTHRPTGATINVRAFENQGRFSKRPKKP